MSRQFLGVLPLLLFSLLIVFIGYFVFLGGSTSTVEPSSTPSSISTPDSAATSIAVKPTPTNTTVPTFTPTIAPTSTPTSTSTPTNTPSATPNPTNTPLPTVTSTATNTPGPTSTPPEAVVIAPELNLRAGPGTDFERIGLLRQGDILDIRGRTGNNEWIQVVASNSDIVGWVTAASDLIQLNLALTAVSTVIPPAPPATLTPTVSPTPTIPLITVAPKLLDPQNNSSQYKNRADLSWEWAGSLGTDDYFQVELWNRYNVFAKPIDVAWVKNTFYGYDVIDVAYDREFRWQITVIRGKPIKEKQWSTPENRVWEPLGQPQIISEPSELRTLYVEDTKGPPPPDTDSKDCPGCR